MNGVNEWPMVKLGDICAIEVGKTPARKNPLYWGPGHPWLSIRDMNQGAEIYSTSETITDAAVEEANMKLRPAGSVLFSFKLSIGKVAIAKIPLFTNEAIAALTPVDEGVIDRSYLAHYLRAVGPSLQGNRAVMGTTLNKRSLGEINIPLPPLAEQQRITKILDNAASLIEASTAKINSLDELEESSFLFLFGDESASTTTEEVAAKFKNSIRTGPFGSQLKHGEFVNEGISVLGLDNVVSNQFRWASPRFITPEKYEQLKRYTVHPGDVLISIMGTTGRCVIVPENLPTTINTKHICAITADRARMFPEFLRAAFLWHPEVRQSLRQQTKGAIMAGLNMGIIRNLPLPAPEISQQRAWSEFTTEINNLREKLLKQESLSRELHQTLATRAFAGEL